MKVTLTFDNGPCPEGATSYVLDVLRSTNIRSSFFVTGNQLLRPHARALTHRARDEGHWIGNHTMTHSIMFGECGDADATEREIGSAQDLLGELAHPDRLFRPYGGGGRLNHQLLSLVAVDYLVRHKFTCVLWNSVPKDWLPNWVDRCIENVLANDWTLVVLHDSSDGGTVLLPDLLRRLDELGAEIVQEFPDACVPIRRGQILKDLAPLMPVTK